MRRILFAFLAVLLAAAPARAQSFRKLLEPPVTRADYVKISKMLELSKDQKDAADALFEGFTETLQREADKANKLNQDRTKAIEEKTWNKSDDPGYFAAIEEFGKKKIEGEHAFMADLRSVLTQAQVKDRWPGAERLVRRKLLPAASPLAASSWYRVDLVRCVDEAGLSDQERATIAPMLEDYEVELDKQLARFDGLFWSQGGTYSRPGLQDLERVSGEVGRADAALNHKTARAMLGALSPEGRDKLGSVIRREAYWQVAGFGSQTTVAIRRAAALRDLNDSQRKKVESLRTQWDHDIADVVRTAEDALDRGDEQAARMSKEEWNAAMGDPEQNPFQKAYDPAVKRCAELEKQAVKDLREVLSDEQKKIVWPNR